MKQKGRNKSNGQESIFAHIAVCSACGKGMVFRNDRLKNGAYVCGGYVKRKRSYFSSHIIIRSRTTSAVKDDLKGLIADNVKLEKIYGATNEKANKQPSSYTKELAKINNLLSQLNKEFQSLLQLYSEKVIDIKQFRLQNEYIQAEQTKLLQSKSEIESKLDAKKDMEHQVHAFKQQTSRFAKLDIEDEQVLKQLLQRLIQKIKVNKEGTVKTIHYNVAHPTGIGELLQGLIGSPY
ncbi:recombinase zinc beta ribbon domain-containing protein [Paenibacillus nicotianae]|uniref:Recombinase zinc beta ribbon domain-containing protein n=1 Tax=Paenibacillus nicotianae TaxID=1526551 RepID=A0ABW4V2X5_9BACL